MTDNAMICSKISRSLLLDINQSDAFSDLKDYWSAFFYALEGEFIWRAIPEPKYKLFVTGDLNPIASPIFEEYICEINELLLYSYEEFIEDDMVTDDAIISVEVDCTLGDVIKRVKDIASSTKRYSTFINIYNLQEASNDELLWLTDWLRSHDENMVFILEAEKTGTHSLILNLEEVY